MKAFNEIREINPSEVQSKVQKAMDAGLDGITNAEAYRIIMNCIDLTSLESADTPQKIRDLCYKANNYCKIRNDIPNVAAVCVFPLLVQPAKQSLQNTAIKVSSVVGSFPSGQVPVKIKTDEIRYVIDEGADEVDMIMAVGKFMSGEFNYVFDEIAAAKQCCNSIHLKVILETGELGSLTAVRRASEIALQAGADYIKTSTGKTSVAASPEAVQVMAEAIRDHYHKSNVRAGIKPAGGIADAETALVYFKIVRATLGPEWMNNRLFRIGASKLADKLPDEIRRVQP